MIFKKILSIIFFFIFVCSYAQNESFETFKKTIKTSNKNKIKVEFDSRLSNLRIKHVADSIIVETILYQIEIGDSLKDKHLKNLGKIDLLAYPDQIEKPDLVGHYLKAASYQNSIGNQDIAFRYTQEALKIAETLNNDSIIAKVYSRLGVNFKNSGDTDLAKKYLNMSLNVGLQNDDSLTISSAYMVLGNVCKNAGEYDSAMYYYNKSMIIARFLKNDRFIAGNYNNIGNVYKKRKQYDNAIDNFLDAIVINEIMGNKQWLSYNFHNLASAYSEINKINESLYYFEKSIKVKKELEDYQGTISTLQNMSEAYAKKRDYYNGYKALKESQDLKFKYTNQEKLNMISEIEAKYQVEKKESQINQLEKEYSLQDALILGQKKELKMQEQLRKDEQRLVYAMAFILISLLGVVYIFWRSSKERTRYTKELHTKNNEIRNVNFNLEKAQDVLTQKNEEITDSITYAKRIQAAILPSISHLQSFLKDAFILYLPKDIVAGDFYWTEKVDNTILFAVADCTGHGVPGAMVSVVCNNALNTTIKQKNITDPGKILDHTTDIVLSQFEKSEEEVKDGMDIALCAFNRDTRKLKYAGANIPIWIARGGEILEIKATRQPVGKHMNRNNFVSHDIDIQDGDMVYLSSDGFADQFGGKKNKKFMKKNFKNLLISLSNEALDTQNSKIENAFIDWRMDQEQVDDICVMGVRFEK